MSVLNAARVLSLLVSELRGFAPFVATHLTVRRADMIVQLEKEWTRSYYRVARSIELQPEMKGLTIGSWLFDERTHRVTPHLNWTRKIFEENGGLVIDLGEAAPDAGFLVGSKARQKLYDSGQFRPKETMVLWPRRAMLEWAEKRSDLEEVG
jgi:hypothetical protein